jgi:hypothetical protein
MTRDMGTYMLLLLLLLIVSSQTGCHRLNFNVIAMS